MIYMNTENINVIKGDDGFLFLYLGAQKQMPYLLGEIAPTEKSCEVFLKNISNRAEICKKNNLIFKHVVFPSKPLVKSKFLPPSASDISSLYKKYYLPLAINNSAVLGSIIYPLDELINLDREKSTFFKTDTHMTDAGSLCVLEMICDALNIEKISRNIIHSEKREFIGDLSLMLGGATKEVEDFFACENQYLLFDNSPQLKGNTNNICIIHSPNASSNKRLLIFGDSFFRCMLKFFHPIFRDILFIRTQFFHPEYIHLFKPDVVLTGNAERYLANVHPDDQSNLHLLGLYGDTRYSPEKNFIDALNAQLSYGENFYIYDRWRRNLIGKNLISFDKAKLNQIIFSNNIGDKNSSLNFISIGVDPYFIFNKLLFLNCDYVFSIEYFSSKDSFCSLYFTRGEGKDDNFIGSDCITRRIKNGHNRIDILIPQRNFGSKFRFDPLSEEGEFEIFFMSLKPKAFT